MQVQAMQTSGRLEAWTGDIVVIYYGDIVVIYYGDIHFKKPQTRARPTRRRRCCYTPTRVEGMMPRRQGHSQVEWLCTVITTGGNHAYAW